MGCCTRRILAVGAADADPHSCWWKWRCCCCSCCCVPARLGVEEKNRPCQTILQQQMEPKCKKSKNEPCEVWIVLHRKHEHERALGHDHKHESTTTSTRAQARARKHEHEGTSTRARARGGQAISASRQQNSQRRAQPVGHFLYPVRGFAWAWMALRARNASPWLLANVRDFEPQSTCHGPRPGPTLAPWCSGGLLVCPGAESTKNDPGPEEKKMPMCKKEHIYTYLVVSIGDRSFLAALRPHLGLGRHAFRGESVEKKGRLQRRPKRRKQPDLLLGQER